MKSFKVYEDAATYARALCAEIGCAVGIEKMEDYTSGHGTKKSPYGVVYLVKLLPKKEFRQGWELRCEAIEPGGVS